MKLGLLGVGRINDPEPLDDNDGLLGLDSVGVPGVSGAGVTIFERAFGWGKNGRSKDHDRNNARPRE